MYACMYVCMHVCMPDLQPNSCLEIGYEAEILNSVFMDYETHFTDTGPTAAFNGVIACSATPKVGP